MFGAEKIELQLRIEYHAPQVMPSLFGSFVQENDMSGECDIVDG